VGGKPYPVSLRALSFEKMFSMRDHDYNQSAGHTYAQTLRNTFAGMRQIATTTRTPEEKPSRWMSWQTLSSGPSTPCGPMPS